MALGPAQQGFAVLNQSGSRELASLTDQGRGPGRDQVSGHVPAKLPAAVVDRHGGKPVGGACLLAASLAAYEPGLQGEFPLRPVAGDHTVASRHLGPGRSDGLKEARRGRGAWTEKQAERDTDHQHSGQAGRQPSDRAGPPSRSGRWPARHIDCGQASAQQVFGDLSGIQGLESLLQSGGLRVPLLVIQLILHVDPPSSSAGPGPRRRASREADAGRRSTATGQGRQSLPGCDLSPRTRTHARSVA